MIEDCAHAIESEYKGRKTGTFGEFGCFSFYVTKNIVTGEGGMVLTRNEEDSIRIKVLALHGMSKDAWMRFPSGDEGYKHYSVIECGFKYNMMNLQAPIGIHQLHRIESYWQRRRDIWHRYNEAFAALPIELSADPDPETRHSYHLYTILVNEGRTGIGRDAFLNAMTSRNIDIDIGVHYLSIPEHLFYQNAFGWKPEDSPNAMWNERESASLPISAKPTDRDVEEGMGSVVQIIS